MTGFELKVNEFGITVESRYQYAHHYYKSMTISILKLEDLIRTDIKF